LDRKILKGHPKSAKLADLRAPFHAAKTVAARSVSVRDEAMIFILGR
jgi:hypothetical protein